MLDASEISLYTCYYCGLFSSSVEAGGIWHCPNLLCRGPGAAWFRATLSSYRKVKNDEHTVDECEWEAKAYIYILEHKSANKVAIPWKR